MCKTDTEEEIQTERQIGIVKESDTDREVDGWSLERERERGRQTENLWEYHWSLIVQNLVRPHHGYKPSASRCSHLTQGVSSLRSL